ncbi:hypothetical protein NEDG_01749 [Nematocida displodere]|uniref:C3H1-type domain-containing protein n=1 Tax=Nematocida displodere TaxID=1805483 RepID=A0A177EEM6_9MICR|nr:hypothetical protein NEDG_01749 [Nematocida displodere]
MREDCFYFITAACARGSECIYRHSLPAKNTQTICNNWTRGIECEEECIYRHSRYQVRTKKNVHCHWDKQGGCKKTKCEYLHWSNRPNLLNLSQIHSAITEAPAPVHAHPCTPMPAHAHVHAHAPVVPSDYMIDRKAIEDIEKEITELNQFFRF